MSIWKKKFFSEPKPETKQQPSANPGLFASVVAAYR